MVGWRFTPAACCSRGKRAEGNALGYLVCVADDGRFADDHASGVIDEEVLADGGSRVDVDGGAAMGAYSVMMRGMSGTFCA